MSVLISNAFIYIQQNSQSNILAYQEPSKEIHKISHQIHGTQLLISKVTLANIVNSYAVNWIDVYVFKNYNCLKGKNHVLLIFKSKYIVGMGSRTHGAPTL